MARKGLGAEQMFVRWTALYEHNLRLQRASGRKKRRDPGRGLGAEGKYEPGVHARLRSALPHKCAVSGDGEGHLSSAGVRHLATRDRQWE